jgi:hypothetical protein
MRVIVTGSDDPGKGAGKTGKNVAPRTRTGPGTVTIGSVRFSVFRESREPARFLFAEHNTPNTRNEDRTSSLKTEH